MSPGTQRCVGSHKSLRHWLFLAICSSHDDYEWQSIVSSLPAEEVGAERAPGGIAARRATRPIQSPRPIGSASMDG